MVTINTRDVVIGESDGYVDIVVSLSAPAPSLVTVNYTTANGTAREGISWDYLGISGTLNFTAGETTKVVRVALSEHDGVEGLEYFRFNLSSPTNAAIGQGSAMVSIVDDDTVVDTPSVFVRDVVVDEKAGTAGFVVMLGGPTGQSSHSTVTVDFATADGTATAGSDYLARSGTLTFAPGDSVKTVVVDITDDALAEGLERFALNLSNANGATIVDGEGLAEIGANDATAVSQPRISVPNLLTVGESDGYVDIVVSLSAPAQNSVTVNYTTANGTAREGISWDYLGISGTLNFTAGETTKVVRVALSEDDGVEDWEYFQFNLSSPTNAAIGQGSAMVSIVDDDTVVDTPSVFVRDVVVDEKAGTAGFVVMLGGPTGQSSHSTVTVDFATADGTATAGSDYLARSGTLTFAPGDSVKTVVVDITDDALAEGLERFALNLSNANGATIVDGEGLAEIGANDATAVSQPRISVPNLLTVGESDGYVDIVVSLSAPAQNSVTVNYTTANGTAREGISWDYLGISGTLNFTAGETTKVVRVALSEDDGVEDWEYFQFNLSSPTNAAIGQGSAMVSIVDDDTVVDTPSVFVRDVVVDEKAGTAGFVVMLGGPTGQSSHSTVTVDFATADGTATAGSDYLARSGTLTFAPGDSVKTVVVDITDDALAEGLERFALNLSNANGATIVDGEGLAEIGANDATAVSQPRISVPNLLTVGESDGYVDIVVSLSAPAQNSVTVNYTTANGTAREGISWDYLGISGTLNFTAGETTKVVRVALSEHDGVEDWEYFQFNLSSPTNAAIGQGSSKVWIVDNDTVLETPTLFISNVEADEKVGTARFVVTLGDFPQGSASNSTVTVDYATADGTATAGSDYVARSGTLSFAPGESAKTIVVDVVDDQLAELAENFRLNLSNATNALIGTTSASATIFASTGSTDTTAPTVLSFSPTDGATGVATSSNIVLTFSESITRGTGSLLLKTAAGATVETFDAATSNRLTLSGSTLTIDPTSDLANGTNYYVTLAAGTIQDLAGNAYAGITTYDFTTASSTSPLSKQDDFVVLQYASPSVVGAGVGNDTYLLSNAMLPAGTKLTITDPQGSNSIQLASGLAIASSKLNSNTLQLTLSNGSEINVLGADRFTYEAGGNATAGINLSDVSYATFVQTTLGVALPTGSTIASGGAVTIGSGLTGVSPIASSKQDDFVVLQYASPSVVGAGVGNDTYLLSNAMLPAGTKLTITDPQGSNSIQLASGLAIASSKLNSNTLQLTLSNGSEINVLGADRFTYEAGGNATAGINLPDVELCHVCAEYPWGCTPHGFDHCFGWRGDDRE
jgi:methionine-rich copper-binding protein CopC/uncharacterized protein YegP (UPF0339 family)